MPRNTPSVDRSASERLVADVMSAPVVTASAAETVSVAALRMSEGRVGSVVVTDSQRRAIGILTERDMIRLAAAGADPLTAKVSEWMTGEPDTLAPDVAVSTAFARLAEHGYRHIPVVREHQVVGIVSMRDLIRVAAIQPADVQAHEVPKGLEGVIVAETAIGDVRGQEGFYHYRQYNAVELAKTRPIEDVWRLLIDGSLPASARERAAFVEEVTPLRVVPASLQPLLAAIARSGNEFVPLDGVRSAVSLIAQAEGFRASLDIDQRELRANALRVCAVVPTLVGALWRHRAGLEPIEPHADLGYAANYLYMINGEVPLPEHAAAVEKYLVSTIDHGFNASTFTARVITSTGADLGAAVVGAIGALSGPLHGGAPSRALAMLDGIGTIDNADAWLRDAVARGDRLMGFGHRVYKTDDPRSMLLRDVARSLGGPRQEFAEFVENKAVEVLAELKPGRALYTNVEFYAGVVMDSCGVPRELFTPTFAASRVIGWCAHILEQASDNRLIRPSCHYTGPPPPQPVPDLQ